MVKSLLVKIRDILGKSSKYWVLVFFIFLFAYRLWNSWHFNPYWGYDGGGHINYLFSLIKNWSMPSLADNTVAWHEPLYYFLFWPIGSLLKLFFPGNDLLLLKAFGVLQACLSVGVSYLMYSSLKILNKGQKIKSLAITIFLTFLPPLNQASTFLTNELLNYWFIFLLIYYWLKNFLAGNPKIKNYLLFGVIGGLSLLSKISALIVVAVCLLLMLYQIRSQLKTKLKYIGLLLLVILAINTPWLIYKNNHLIKGISINNSVFLTPQPLKIDSRINFFIGFDFDVFKFPFWYAGGRNFWSMLYADSFYDYYGSIENKEHISYLIKNNPRTLIETTLAPTYVEAGHFKIASFLSFYALLILLALVWGFILLIVNIVKNKQREISLFGALTSLGFLAALMLMAYRYPYYDHGIVKSIFIFPIYFFPAWSFFDFIFSKKYLTVIFLPLVSIYILMIVKYYFIINFGY